MKGRMSTVAAVVVVILIGHGGVAAADTNPQPIAVPMLGTEGVASLYPSTIEVAARGGLEQTGTPRVTLHHVTHPCPEELAIVLVHNNTDRFLLMSNAGGCRPLQGTTISFLGGAVTLPDTEPASPPHGAFLNFDASNYGSTPILPNVPIPYFPVVPLATTNINGTWSLYVFDTTPGNRGVIAGGWSLNYDTTPSFDAEQTDVTVPVGPGTGPGPAAHYPITFDLSTVPSGVPALSVSLDVTLHHSNPDNIRMVLQHPRGPAVVLMANAGGGTDIALGTTLRFRDTSPSPVPDNMPIAAGLYRPGGAYGGNIALASPAPQPPYETTFEALENQSAVGTWRLWVYDDAVSNFGAIESATLTIITESPPAMTMTGQAAPLAFTADQPFVRFEGTVTDQVSPYAFTWRSVVDGEFYAAGAFTRRPGTNQVYADVPMKEGTNAVTSYVRTTSAAQLSVPRTVTVNEFTYSLAEGATGGFFDLDVTLANPTPTNAPVSVDFLLENGAVVHLGHVVGDASPLQLRVDTYVPGAATSTVVRSTAGVPLAVERTMSWDARGYGGHGGSSVAPATRWLFAEGSQGYFNTYVLLANDNATPVDVTVEFLLEGGGVVPVPVSVAAQSRYTLFAGEVAALVDRSFGIDITASQPIIAERAMYLPGPHLFEGGHESAGVNSPSTNWFLAEGATGSFFDCFVLLSNPTGAAANVTLTYLLPSGATIVQPVVVPANSRTTINVETVDPQLANTAVSTTIVSDVGIVAERAMYWPDLSQGWIEAHNSFGVTETALRWGVADGRVGGPRAHQTYILLANPNPVPAEVEVTFLKPAVTISRSFTLAPTSRLNIWANGDVPELGEGVFGADIRVVNYQPIAVEKALYWDAEGVTWAAGTNVTATRLPPP